jgi:hypothetical protein
VPTVLRASRSGQGSPQTAKAAQGFRFGERRSAVDTVIVPAQIPTRHGGDGAVSTPLDDALRYAARGWRVLALNGKSPAWLGEGWQNRTTTDPEVIRRWWNQQSSFNVGVAPAGQLVFIDVDPRHGGDDLLHDLERELGALPPTPSYLTGGHDNGWRLIFKHPGCKLRTGLGGKGLSIFSDHGQVVIPHSVHPDTGRRYEWENDPDEVPLAELPEAWLARLRAPDHPSAPTSHDSDDVLLNLRSDLWLPALTGLVVPSSRKVICPLPDHEADRKPSLHLYERSWKCYGCPDDGRGQYPGRGGSIFTFAAILWGYPLPLRDVSFLAVNERLCDTLIGYLERQQGAV